MVRTLLFLGGVAALALAPSAEAKIVVQKSIGGIELRMTRADVVAARGEPDGEKVVPHEITGRQRVMRYGKTRAYLSGTRAASEVVAIITTDRRERTKRRVGVGVREQIVRRRVRGVRCMTEAGRRLCTVGRLEPGRRVTTFYISRRTTRVTRVLVGIVVD